MSTLLLTHRDCLAHDPGAGHPECPERLVAVMRALEAQEFSALVREEAPEATPEQLALVHPAEYVSAILELRPRAGERIALDPDTLVGPGSVLAARRAVGAGVAAVDAVMRGEHANAFCAVRPCGHHAEPARAMGFCLFSSAAIAARHARVAHGVERVAVLDFDVHHGNGTQAAFERDASVFFASSHQMPLFPGTGAVRERGVGNILNVPLPPGAGGEAFRAAWADKVMPALESFAPGLIVISAGFDAHARDPLAQLRLREEDFAHVTTAICEAARRLCGGRVVSLLEGGYDLEALASSTAAHVLALMRA